MPSPMFTLVKQPQLGPDLIHWLPLHEVLENLQLCSTEVKDLVEDVLVEAYVQECISPDYRTPRLHWSRPHYWNGFNVMSDARARALTHADRKASLGDGKSSEGQQEAKGQEGDKAAPPGKYVCTLDGVMKRRLWGSDEVVPAKIRKYLVESVLNNKLTQISSTEEYLSRGTAQESQNLMLSHSQPACIMASTDGSTMSTSFALPFAIYSLPPSSVALSALHDTRLNLSNLTKLEVPRDWITAGLLGTSQSSGITAALELKSKRCAQLCETLRALPKLHTFILQFETWQDVAVTEIPLSAICAMIRSCRAGLQYFSLQACEITGATLKSDLDLKATDDLPTSTIPIYTKVLDAVLEVAADSMEVLDCFPSFTVPPASGGKRTHFNNWEEEPHEAVAAFFAKLGLFKQLIKLDFKPTRSFPNKGKLLAQLPPTVTSLVVQLIRTDFAEMLSSVPTMKDRLRSLKLWGGMGDRDLPIAMKELPVAMWWQEEHKEFLAENCVELVERGLRPTSIEVTLTSTAYAKENFEAALQACGPSLQQLTIQIPDSFHTPKVDREANEQGLGGYIIQLMNKHCDAKQLRSFTLLHAEGDPTGKVIPDSFLVSLAENFPDLVFVDVGKLNISVQCLMCCAKKYWPSMVGFVPIQRWVIEPNRPLLSPIAEAQGWSNDPLDWIPAQEEKPRLFELPIVPECDEEPDEEPPQPHPEWEMKMLRALKQKGKYWVPAKVFDRLL